MRIFSAKKQDFLLYFARLFVTLALPKLLCLGNKKKNKIFFCISLDFS